MLFVVVVLSIWAVQHLYVGWRLWAVPPLAGRAARLGLIAVLGAGFLCYPLGRALFAAGAHGLGRGLEYAGALWMGTVFLLFAFLLVADLVTLGGLVLRAAAPSIRGAAACLALAAAAFAWIGGLRSPRVVEVSAPIAGLPAAAAGLTIAQVSDVHLGTILGRGRWSMILDRVSELAPDVVAVTGDLVDGDAGVVEEMLPELRRLRAPYGVYAVLGNHEYYAGRDRSRALFRDAGWVVLDNAAVEVVPGLWLAGVPDARGSAQTGAAEADLERALVGIPADAAVVLLQHAPEEERRAAGAGVDLMLDGHTHGGQIWPFHLLVRRAYPNMAGVYRVGEMTQVVSRGAGQWGPPMRLFAPAEIVRVTLRPAGD